MKEKVEFAGNYPGPLYAPHPDLVKQKDDQGDTCESVPIKHPQQEDGAMITE